MGSLCSKLSHGTESCCAGPTGFLRTGFKGKKTKSLALVFKLENSSEALVDTDPQATVEPPGVCIAKVQVGGRPSSEEHRLAVGLRSKRSMLGAIREVGKQTPGALLLNHRLPLGPEARVIPHGTEFCCACLSCCHGTVVNNVTGVHNDITG